MPLQVGLDPSAKRFFTFWFLLFTVHQLAVSLFRSACSSWSSSACSIMHLTPCSFGTAAAVDSRQPSCAAG